MSPEREQEKLARACEKKIKRFEEGKSTIIGCTDEEFLAYLMRGFERYCEERLSEVEHVNFGGDL